MVQITEGNVTELTTPDQENANKGTERGAGMLRVSLEKHGAGRSILVDKEGRIIAGNKTVEQAVDLGIEDLIVVQTDGTKLVAVQRTDLDLESDPAARELAYADNRVGQVNLDFDPIQMAADLEAGIDLSRWWLDDEIAALVDGFREPVPDPGPQVDKAQELQEKWQVERGQIWEIPSLSVPGKCHRVVCGDSTCEGDVGRLMGGELAVLFATDPPYGCNAGNIGFTAQRDDIEVITKDDLEGAEMQAFLETVFSAWIPHLRDDCAWYLWHPMLTQGYFAAAAAAAAAADLVIHRQIIWRKEQFIFGRGDYHWRHELCFYGWRKNHRPQFYGERNQDTIWDIPWGVKRGKIGHPTTKPIELFAIPMRNHTLRGSICAEPFVGSGSQVVAAEQTGRLCYGMEIVEKYVAVTLERLQNMGLSPQLAQKV